MGVVVLVWVGGCGVGRVTVGGLLRRIRVWIPGGGSGVRVLLLHIEGIRREERIGFVSDQGK